MTEGSGPVKSGNLLVIITARCQFLRRKPRDEGRKANDFPRCLTIPGFLLRKNKKERKMKNERKQSLSVHIGICYGRSS